NARLQVEHPVTELVHGIDLLAAQVAIARGEKLPEIPAARGHAIEARVCAEDPANGFLPSTGTLWETAWPAGPGIRVDSGVARGSDVTAHYDSLLAKICAWGETRERAAARLREALAATFIAGVQTTIPFCREFLASETFRDLQYHTTYAGEHLGGWQPEDLERDGAASGDPERGARWLRAATAAARRVAGTPAGVGRGAGPRGPLPLWSTLADWGRAR
ncbi:MAG: hypothetical protein L0Z55_11570, partial [Planctomycetes bacterium]|nr:hypothetical protein [Planctomycetota bacterium]